jgi:hypothetical protein
LRGKILIVTFFLYISLLANGVGFIFEDTSLAFRENHKIQLVEELLTFKELHNCMLVETFCTFKNLDSTVQEIRLGFPMTCIDETRSWGFWVNDMLTARSEYLNVGPNFWDFLEMPDTFGDIVMFNLRFEPLEEKKIFIRDVERWKNTKRKRRYIESELQAYRESITYLLKPSSKFLGKIKDFEILFNLPTQYRNEAKDFSYKMEISPKGYKWIGDTTLIWNFKDFEPEEDLKVTITSFLADTVDSALINYFSRYSYYSINYFKGSEQLLTEDDLTHEGLLGKDKCFDLKHQQIFHDKLLLMSCKLFINTIYAIHGFEFKNYLWTKFFKKRKWYKPSSQFDKNSFNEIEKKNISFIRNYMESLPKNNK